MSDASIFAERAVATYEAMQRWFYIGDHRSLYRETSPKSAPDAFVWPFSRALQGTLSLAGVSPDLVGSTYAAAVTDRLLGLTRYWDKRARRPAYDSAVRPWIGRGGDKYHDDNVWIALALVQCYRMGLIDSLSGAAELFAFGLSGWDTQASRPNPGGVFWVQQGVGFGMSNHDRGTGTSAGNAMLGFHLAELSHPGEDAPERQTQLVEARRMIDWVDRYLSSTPNGAGPFWNAMDENGRIDRNLWSYNQGVVIGARVLQHRIAREQSVLHQAEAVARQALATFGDFRNHPPSFNAMCFQNLLLLFAATPDRELQADIVRTLRGYADWTWDPATGARDPATNLFRFADDGRPMSASQPAKLQDQGALVHLYALLAWSPADYSKLG